MKTLQTLALFSIMFLGGLESIAQQNCTFSCPQNIIIKTEDKKEGAIVSFPAITALGDCGSITYSPASGSFFRIGSHSIIATSASGQKCSFTLTVTDNEPPFLSEITLSSSKVWPPSNKLKKVGVFYTTTDNTINVTSTLTVTSNDAKSKEKDYEIINNHLVRLKAARLPGGEPRIFTITVTSVDDHGNKTSRSTSIAVSKTLENM